jgi:methionine-rich copper-binding protein CopC
VDHPLRLDRTELAIRPWRTATLVVAGIAALELVLLVMLAGALLAKPATAHKAVASKTVAAKHATKAAPPVKTTKTVKAAAAQLPRRKVTVLVLNGNGRRGAAAAAASRVSGKGYKIGLVANAPSHDYAASLVMFRPGFKGEAQRLARDLGVHVVSPLDGVRPGQLHGAQAVLILGG